MKYDYEKVREMSDAKRKQDMKNKTGNGASKSKSSVKAGKGKGSTESISTPATRKAKQTKDMKNKVGDSSSKSKSSVKAVKGKSSKESISTPATRKAKQKQDMKNIRGPGAVDKSSPTQKQKASKKKTTASNSTMTQIQKDKGNIRNTPKKKTESKPATKKESSWLSSLFGGQDRNVNPKTATKVDEDLQKRHGGRSGSSYAKGGVVKPRGWGKARIPGK